MISDNTQLTYTNIFNSFNLEIDTETNNNKIQKDYFILKYSELPKIRFIFSKSLMSYIVSEFKNINQGIYISNGKIHMPIVDDNHLYGNILSKETNSFLHKSENLNIYLSYINYNLDYFLKANSLFIDLNNYSPNYDNIKDPLLWVLYSAQNPEFKFLNHNFLVRLLLRYDFSRNQLESENYIDLAFLLTSDKNILLNIETKQELRLLEVKDIARTYLMNLHIHYGVYYTLIESNNHKNTFQEQLYKEVNNKLDPIMQVYNYELLNYFDVAKTSDDPFIKYLSYYHILEYFLEDMHYKQIIDSTRNKIKKTSFQISNDSDIKDLIISINNKMGNKDGDRIKFNELQALVQVIKVLGDLPSVKQSINQYPEIYENKYYEKNIDFLDLKAINLSNPDDVARRIYTIRNALVHSKNSSKQSYNNKKDSHHLINELPLIELIAKNIIINSAEDII